MPIRLATWRRTSGFNTAGDTVSASWARYGSACPRGDMNCDQTVTELDTPLFIDALLAAPSLSTCDAYTANLNADTNPDGTPKIDGADIQPFLTCLLTGPCPRPLSSELLDILRSCGIF